MATKEELFKTNPPKGTKAWSEKEDAQQAQKGTQQYVDGTAVVNTPQQKKEDEKKNIVDNTKKNPQLATNVQRKRYQPNYYQHVKDDLIDITEKKEETKQQSETPVKQQDNTIDPKEVKKELNELVYGVPLYHNDSPVGYKKTDAPAQQQHHRPSIKTKGLPTDEELLQYAPESEISSNTTKKEEKKEVTKEANYDVPEQEFDPMGYKRGNKEIQVDVPSKPVSTPTPAKEEVTKEETVKTPSEEEVKQSEVESETQSKPADNTADNTADGKKSLSYVEMYEQLNPKPDPEQIKKQLKRQRTRNIISAIGDGVSALSNLHFTTKGAPNMYDGKNTLTEKSQARYDKLMKDYKDDLEAWRQGRMKAEQMDQEMQWRKDQADRAQDNWEKQFDANEEARKQAQKNHEDAVAYKKERDAKDDEAKAAAAKQAQKNADREYNYKTSQGNQTSKDEEKDVIYLNDGEKAIAIDPKKWKNNYHNLYGKLVEEGVIKEQRGTTPTSDQMEAAVKRYWKKSSNVTQDLLDLSDNHNGFDRQFGDINIPYAVWVEEFDNIFDAMMKDGGFGVYEDSDVQLVRQSKIANLKPEKKQQIILEHLQESPSALRYLNEITGGDFSQYIDDDNTMPGVSNNNSDNTMPGVK